MITNEQFMADLERDFPDEDWDKVPDPDTFPDVYTVHGQQWDVQWMKGMRPPYWDCRTVSFSVDGEFSTIEEAQVQVEKCKAWPKVVPWSLEIKTCKPVAAVDKFLMKEFRADILAGKKVFPMYLP